MQVTGSIKFDGAQTHRANPATQALAQAAGLAEDDIVFLAGSTQQPEESLALATYQSLRDRFPRLRLILVPRHPERFAEVAEMLTSSGVAWQRRSHLATEGVRPGGARAVGRYRGRAWCLVGHGHRRLRRG